MNEASFFRKWWIANTLAFLVGYLLYTPIAHGITGHHPNGMTPIQILAHAIAMAVAAALVVAAQRAALRGRVMLPWWRTPFVMVAFPAIFLIAYYWVSMPIDSDIFLGFTALGCLGWLGAFPASGRRVRIILAVLTFAVANVLGQVIGLVTALGLGMKPEQLQTSMFVHSYYFVTVALVTGLVAGAASGWILAPVVPPAGGEPRGTPRVA